MNAEQWDAIVVGAGQAGPALAMRLARAGHRTALVERADVGGTCVNTGCTPTKALVASARIAHLARRAGEFGVRVGADVSVDFTAVFARMDGIVRQSRDGLTQSLQRTAGLSLLPGHARFVAGRTIAVGDRSLTAPRIFLNVGSRPAEPAWASGSGVPYFTSDTLLGLKEPPAHLVIVGGSYVGLEFAQIFRRLGSEVTVIEQSDALLQREDEEAAAGVRDLLESEGIRFAVGANCFGLEHGASKGGAAVLFTHGGARRRIEASHVLLAVGRQPNTDDLGLDEAGVVRDGRGFVPVDGQLRTGVPGVWALGDMNGRGAFTHTSWNDYEVVAANVLDGGSRSIDQRIVAYAMFLDPPLARIGDSQRQARARPVPVLAGSLPMTRVGRARERSETRGFMKVLVDAGSMRLLGATLFGIDADEVIHSLLAIQTAGIDVRTMAASVPIHPTISELIPTLLARLEPL